MSEYRHPEERSWAEEESGGEGLVEEMKRAVERLREQFGEYRERVSRNDNDNGDGFTSAD